MRGEKLVWTVLGTQIFGFPPTLGQRGEDDYLYKGGFLEGNLNEGKKVGKSGIRKEEGSNEEWFLPNFLRRG